MSDHSYYVDKAAVAPKLLQFITALLENGTAVIAGYSDSGHDRKTLKQVVLLDKRRHVFYHYFGLKEVRCIDDNGVYLFSFKTTATGVLGSDHQALVTLMAPPDDFGHIAFFMDSEGNLHLDHDMDRIWGAL